MKDLIYSLLIECVLFDKYHSEIESISTVLHVDMANRLLFMQHVLADDFFNNMIFMFYLSLTFVFRVSDSDVFIIDVKQARREATPTNSSELGILKIEIQETRPECRCRCTFCRAAPHRPYPRKSRSSEFRANLNSSWSLHINTFNTFVFFLFTDMLLETQMIIAFVAKIID